MSETAGSSAVLAGGIVSNVLVPALSSPMVAGLIAALGLYLVYRLIRRCKPERSEREFRWAQVASAYAGYPLSTTQVVSGAVTGSGVGRPGAKVHWVVARRIVYGWLFTLPAAAAVGGLVFGIIDVLGGGVVGVSAVAAIAAYSLWKANRAQAVEPHKTISENPAFGPGAPVQAAA